MKIQLNLKFADLICDDKDKSLFKEKKLIARAYDYNKKFFNIDLPMFKIVLIYSRKEFNKLFGDKTEKFVSGFIKDNQIVIFSYSVFNKETKWRKKDFYPCLLHEINHLFYEEIRNESHDPLWLSEGLATVIQCRGKRLKHRKKLGITKEILLQKSNEMNVERYHVYYLFVNYLIKTFGKNKLLEFINGLKKEKKSDLLFKKIYKKSLGELIEDANKYQKTIRSK